MQILEWDNPQIPHKLWVEELSHGRTKVCLSVVKDLEPEQLCLELAAAHVDVIEAWQGKAIAVSSEYHDAHLYSQVRCLLNLANGCVLWAVNHIQLPDGNKMSADKLVFVPLIREAGGIIVPA